MEEARIGGKTVGDKDLPKICIRPRSGPVIVTPPAPAMIQVPAVVGENCVRASVVGEHHITPASQHALELESQPSLKGVSATERVRTSRYSSGYLDKGQPRKSSSSIGATSCGDRRPFKKRSSSRAVAAATDVRYATKSTRENHQACSHPRKPASTLQRSVIPSAERKPMPGSNDSKGGTGLARTHYQKASPSTPSTSSTVRSGTMHSVSTAKPSENSDKSLPSTADKQTSPSCGEICRNGYDIYGFRDPKQKYKHQHFLRLAKADIEYVKRTNDLQRAKNDLQRCNIQHSQARNWSCWAYARVHSASRAASALPTWEKEATAALEIARLEKFNAEDTVRDAEGYLRLSRSRLAEASKILLCDKVVAKERAELALRRYDGEVQDGMEDGPVGDSSAALNDLEAYCNKMEARGKAGVMYSTGISLRSGETGEGGTIGQAAGSPSSRKRSRGDDTSTVDHPDGDPNTSRGETCFHRSSRRPKHKVLTRGEIEDALKRGRIAENAIRQRVARQEAAVCAVVNIPTAKEDSLTADETERCPRAKQHESRAQKVDHDERRAALVHAVDVAKLEIKVTQRNIWELSRAAACASLALDMARAAPKVVTATAKLAAAEQALETAKRNKGPARLWLERELDNEKKAEDWKEHVEGDFERSYGRWKAAEVEYKKAKLEKNAAAAAVDALPEEMKRGFQCTPQNMFKLVAEESYYKDRR